MNIANTKMKKAQRRNLFIMSVALLIAFGQQAQAHTRLTVASTPESSSAHGTTQTAVNVPHGCGDNPVIGNVFFLPDTTDAIVQTSTDNFQNFETPEGDTALNHIVNPPFIRLIKSNEVFDTQEFILDPLGNPIGFWAAGGSLPAHNWVAQLPIRITSVAIQPESCATKIVFTPAIANICNVTSLAEIDGSNYDDPNVDFWTAPGVGTVFDAASWSYPASYTVERDLENNPLPASCGDGIAVRIVPSANQMNRDMLIKSDGQQIWPLP